MRKFFSVSDNSFNTKGFPWAAKIVKKETIILPHCKMCGLKEREHFRPGDITVLLERNKGTKWSDVLGCGSYPLFIVSQNVIKAWEKEKMGDIPLYNIFIDKPYPKKLENSNPPNYYWIDGKKLNGALFDFEASGFVDVKFCPECGRRTENISATHRRQNSAVIPYKFKEGTWNGLNLFATDLSPAAFFCTEKILECAKKYKLTNFRFTPIEEGKATSSKGIDYLK